MDGSTQTRAAFLRGAGLDGAAPLQRPPWTDEARIKAHCTSCAGCIDACPEAILVAGPAGTPVVDFSRDACSFCGACAEACEEDVFVATDTAPWDLHAMIGSKCLLVAGISCQTCTDACDTSALRFDYRGGPVGRILVDGDACTGCGACLSVCPTRAVHLISDRTEAA